MRVLSQGDTAVGATGGVIQDGLYVLTQAIAHGDPPPEPGITLRATRRFQAGVLSATVHSASEASQSSGPYEVDGAGFTWTASCPEPSTHTFGFTAVDFRLTIYETRGSVVYELIHERQ